MAPMWAARLSTADKLSDADRKVILDIADAGAGPVPAPPGPRNPQQIPAPAIKKPAGSPPTPSARKAGAPAETGRLPTPPPKEPAVEPEATGKPADPPSPAPQPVLTAKAADKPAP